MPKITPLTYREVCRKLKKLGFDGPFSGGKHPFMKKDSQRIPVPNHGGKDVSRGVVEEIIDTIEISRDEWIGL